MSEFSSFATREIATQRIADQIATADRSRIPGQRRGRGRHRFARGLHRVADRLDN
jgi:hypothetical protein